MKKENILKNNYDFQKIIKNNKPYKYREYIIYYEKNDTDKYNFGFSVGKKIGNAITRNKIKRQLRHIVGKKNYQNGFNCIIIVNNSILTTRFDIMEKNLVEALSRLNFIKEN